MINELNPQFDRLEQTTQRILEVLQSVKTELTEFKSEMHEFKSETEEKFEFIIENAVTQTEFKQTIARLEATMATKDQLIHFTDRIDVKFLDLKHDVIESIRRTDKKFLKFAL